MANEVANRSATFSEVLTSELVANSEALPKGFSIPRYVKNCLALLNGNDALKEFNLDDERTDISGYLAGLVKDDLSETYSKLVVPLNPEDSESERHSYNFGDNPDDIQLAQQEQDDLDEIANFVEANSGAIDTEYVALINSLRDSEKSKISAENALKKTTDDYGTYTLTAGKLEDHPAPPPPRHHGGHHRHHR